MAEIQPLLIFDTTAILATKGLNWQEWDRFGQSVLPQAVMEELQFLTQRAEDQTQEATAREFIRFAPTSQYCISTAQALVVQGEAEDQNLSKRARLEQSVAECAYALSQQQVGTLTILVSNDRGLVNRIAQLQISNLCAISVAELQQWQRAHHRPAAVDQALNLMPGPPIPASPPSQGTAISTYLSHPAVADRDLSPIPKPTQEKSPQRQSRPSGQGASRAESPVRHKHPVLATLQTLINFVLIVTSLTLLAASGLVAWRVADRQGSEAVWEWLRLPAIPGLYPESIETGSPPP